MGGRVASAGEIVRESAQGVLGQEGAQAGVHWARRDPASRAEEYQPDGSLQKIPASRPRSLAERQRCSAGTRHAVEGPKEWRPPSGENRRVANPPRLLVR